VPRKRGRKKKGEKGAGEREEEKLIIDLPIQIFRLQLWNKSAGMSFAVSLNSRRRAKVSRGARKKEGSNLFTRGVSSAKGEGDRSLNGRRKRIGHPKAGKEERAKEGGGGLGLRSNLTKLEARVSSSYYCPNAIE